MRDDLRKKIDEILARHRTMTLATVRPDGWPQATTVGFFSDGLTLYFLCAATSQKAVNLAHDNRVSLTIDTDTDDLFRIEGLSMAARAFPVTDPDQIHSALVRLAGRYTRKASLPEPDLAQVAVYRVEPTVISVLDYSRGFGHSDLVYMNEPALSA